MKEFKIRCSALSKIMAGEIGLTETQEQKFNELNQRSLGVGKPLTPNMEQELSKLMFKKTNPELPKGAKTYCEVWLKKHLFKRNPEFKALVIDKGLMCEMDGINLISETFGYSDFQKNDEYFENEFMHGTPDIIHNGIVHDTKLSWDLFSFPMFESELPNNDYWWQLQGYMILTGLEKASLDYVLIDTPMPLILLDLKKLYYQSGGTAEDWTQENYEALYPNYQFNDIPVEKRIKSFTFDLDKTVESKINERVILCRNYIKQILNA
jgi:hypothetical protein